MIIRVVEDITFQDTSFERVLVELTLTRGNDTVSAEAETHREYDSIKMENTIRDLRVECYRRLDIINTSRAPQL